MKAVKESLSRLLQKMQNLRKCRISENADYLEKKAINQLETGPEKTGKKYPWTTVFGDNIILRLPGNPWNRRYEPCPCLFAGYKGNYPLERAEICET
jgi:hypothetical protein